MVDVAKLRKSLDKANISLDISEPDEWLSTGNHALNFILTGHFDKGIPNRRSMMYWGLSGTGKSFLTGSAAKQAQDKGYFVVYVDTEDAVHKDYLEKIGVDLSDEKFLTIRVSTIEELTSAMAEMFSQFDKDEKVCYIVDSLSMLETEKEAEDFNKGEVKADMGLFAKRLKLFMKNINAKIGDRDNFFIATNHAYQNQDVRNGKGLYIATGGEGFQFIPSISVLLTKLKLKEGTDVVGVRITAETTKSRFTALGGKVTLEVPYDRGIDPLDGLLDMAVDAEMVNQKGAWYSYTNDDGDEVKFQRKNFADHYLNLFDFDDEPEIVEEED